MNMGFLSKAQRRYLEAEDLTGIDEDAQYNYSSDIRQRLNRVLDDLILVAKQENRITYKQPRAQNAAEITFRAKLREFVSLFLTQRKTGYNDYVKDFTAYERAKSLLEVVNAALNEILVQEKVTNVKIAPNSQVSKNRFRNIAVLEMFYWYYPNMEKKRSKLT